MALSEPFDILAEFPGWTTTFEPLWRQEQSRQANGITRLKDFGSPLWTLTASTRSLSRRELDYWRARLEVLENGEQTFLGYSLSRCWPMAYPRGSWPSGDAFDGVSAIVDTLDDNNRALRVSGLPAGFVLSVGDMLQIGDNDLYRVHEAATANVAGLTGLFEVRPHFWVGTAEGDTVSVKRPHCLMTIVPGSVQSPSEPSGRGAISFSAIEYHGPHTNTPPTPTTAGQPIGLLLALTKAA